MCEGFAKRREKFPQPKPCVKTSRGGGGEDAEEKQKLTRHRGKPSTGGSQNFYGRKFDGLTSLMVA